MKLMIFDTETTGLLDYKADLMEKHQPRVMQLACKLVEEDTGEVIKEMCRIAKPDNWPALEDGAFKAHGISIQRCHDEGVPMKEILEEFHEIKRLAERRTGFNVSYDKRMMKREELIYEMRTEADHLHTFCIMQISKDICQIPPTNSMMKAGRKTFKTPNLTEAYTHFFGRGFNKAHDAMADVNATLEIFFKLKEMGKIPDKPEAPASDALSDVLSGAA